LQIPPSLGASSRKASFSNFSYGPQTEEQSFSPLLQCLFFEDSRVRNNKPQNSSDYPDVITRLPKANLPFEGAKGWILQADESQLVFFEFEADVKVPEHRHGYPQWGIVIDGEMELTIDGKPLMCEKDSEYLIPAGQSISLGS